MDDFTFFCARSLKPREYFTLTTHLHLDTFQVLNSHIWLVATVPDSRGLEGECMDGGLESLHCGSGL